MIFTETSPKFKQFLHQSTTNPTRKYINISTNQRRPNFKPIRHIFQFKTFLESDTHKSKNKVKSVSRTTSQQIGFTQNIAFLQAQR